jgi:hypothetical protein
VKKTNFTLFLVAACARCTPDASQADPYSVIEEGEHVVILSDDEDRELCAGSMAHMDEFVARLATEFGVAPPRDEERILFHWVTPEAVDEVCDGSVLGCAPGETIYSQNAPLDHELVHALAAPFGLPRPLFAEGLAVVYEDIGRRPLSDYFVGGPKDVLALVELGQIEFSEASNSYRLAGSFTAFLIDRFGLDDYLQVYSSIDRNASKESIDQVFRDVFGVSLEQSIADFGALPSYLGTGCRQPGFGAKLMECSAPELSWNGESLAFEQTLSCEQDGAIGPFDDKVQMHHTITIPTRGVYELRMYGDEQAAEEMPDFTLVNQAVTGVSLHHCGGCDTAAWMATWYGSTPRQAELLAGVYSLRLHGPAAMSVSLGFTLVRVADSPDTGG